MKRLVKITFEFEDGEKQMIDDVRACALFQSRCNSSGILSGLEGAFVRDNEAEQETST